MVILNLSFMKVQYHQQQKQIEQIKKTDDDTQKKIAEFSKSIPGEIIGCGITFSVEIVPEIM